MYFLYRGVNGRRFYKITDAARSFHRPGSASPRKRPQEVFREFDSGNVLYTHKYIGCTSTTRMHAMRFVKTTGRLQDDFSHVVIYIYIKIYLYICINSFQQQYAKYVSLNSKSKNLTLLLLQRFLRVFFINF